MTDLAGSEQKMQCPILRCNRRTCEEEMVKARKIFSH